MDPVLSIDYMKELMKVSRSFQYETYKSLSKQSLYMKCMGFP